MSYIVKLGQGEDGLDRWLVLFGGAIMSTSDKEKAEKFVFSEAAENAALDAIEETGWYSPTVEMTDHLLDVTKMIGSDEEK